MAEKSRFYHTSMNFFSGLFYKLITLVGRFAVRTVFIYTLDKVYLGVHGLFSDILSLLSLANLGFGAAIAYSLYKPLAEKDYTKVSSLIALYRKVYFYVGLFILLAGLAVVPFMDVIIKNKPDIDHLTFYYLLFLGDTILSYWFFAYRTALFRADQRAHVITYYQGFFFFIKSALQIFILVVYKNFTVYLISSMACTILQNICLAVKAGKDYPVFNHKKAPKLPREEVKHIFSNTSATMLQKVSYKILNGTDSLLISSFVGLEWVGLLALYIELESNVAGVLTQVSGAMHASLGHYFATEDNEKGYHLFLRMEFLNFLLFGFSAICLATLSTPFIILWAGEDFTLTEFVVASLIFRFFVEGYMNMMSVFRSSLGLFTQGRFLPLVAAGVNIALSIGLSYPWGVAGIVLATPLTRILVNVWFMPWVILRKGFNKPVVPFYWDYIKRFCMLAIAAAGMYLASLKIFQTGVTWPKFIGMMMICGSFSAGYLWLCFHRRDEFKFVVDIARNRCLKPMLKKFAH